MIALYKRRKDKAEKTGQRLNVKKYNQAADSSSSLIIIQEILISKCLYYYEFEEIIGTSPNVASSYIAKSRHPDCIIINKLLEDIDIKKNDLFLQSSQNKVIYLEDMSIDLYLLSNPQKNNMVSRINLNYLDNS